MKKLLLFIPLLFLSCGNDLEQDYCGALVVSSNYSWGNVELEVLKDRKYYTLTMPRYYAKYHEGDTLCELTKKERLDSLQLDYNKHRDDLDIRIRKEDLKIKQYFNSIK